MNRITTSLSDIACAQVKRTEIFLWCVLAIAVIMGHLLVAGGPLLSNDSYQYLSAAGNFLEGKPAYTSIVHFDSERSWGRIPSPLTSFPSGFPLSVAAISALGVALETSSLLISVCAFVLLLPLFVWSSRALSLNGWITRLLLVWLIGNSWVSLYATAAAAESLFTLVSFGSVALFLLALNRGEPPARQLALLVGANILLGLSYWIRYAGLFLFAATVLFFLMQLWLKRDKPSLRAVMCLAISGTIIAAGLLRNQILVGNWKGGNTKVVSHPIMAVLREFGVWLHHLFLGGLAPARFGALELLLLLGALPVGILVIRQFASTKTRLWRREPAKINLAVFLFCYVAVYCAGMVYLGITSVISFDTRMFYPIFPALLLLFGIVLSEGEKFSSLKPWYRAAFSIGLLLMTCTYLSINARSYLEQPPLAPHEIVKRQLDGEIEPGVTLRSWIENNVPRDQAIVANRGQATGYLLQRKTVSLVSQEYSDQPWDEQAVRSLMRTYDARFLILYTDGPDIRVLSESPFLTELSRGTLPNWLMLATRSREVMVFRASL